MYDNDFVAFLDKLQELGVPYTIYFWSSRKKSNTDIAPDGYRVD